LFEALINAYLELMTVDEEEAQDHLESAVVDLQY